MPELTWPQRESRLKNVWDERLKQVWRREFGTFDVAESERQTESLSSTSIFSYFFLKTQGLTLAESNSGMSNCLKKLTETHESRVTLKMVFQR